VIEIPPTFPDLSELEGAGLGLTFMFEGYEQVAVSGPIESLRIGTAIPEPTGWRPTPSTSPGCSDDH